MNQTDRERIEFLENEVFEWKASEEHSRNELIKSQQERNQLVKQLEELRAETEKVKLDNASYVQKYEAAKNLIVDKHEENAELKTELEDGRVENNRLLSKLSDVEAVKEDLLKLLILLEPLIDNNRPQTKRTILDVIKKYQ